MIDDAGLRMRGRRMGSELVYRKVLRIDIDIESGIYRPAV